MACSPEACLSTKAFPLQPSVQRKRDAKVDIHYAVVILFRHLKQILPLKWSYSGIIDKKIYAAIPFKYVRNNFRMTCGA